MRASRRARVPPHTCAPHSHVQYCPIRPNNTPVHIPDAPISHMQLPNTPHNMRMHILKRPIRRVCNCQYAPQYANANRGRLPRTARLAARRRARARAARRRLPSPLQRRTPRRRRRRAPPPAPTAPAARGTCTVGHVTHTGCAQLSTMGAQCWECIHACAQSRDAHGKATCVRVRTHMAASRSFARARSTMPARAAATSAARCASS